MIRDYVGLVLKILLVLGFIFGSVSITTEDHILWRVTKISFGLGGR